MHVMHHASLSDEATANEIKHLMVQCVYTFRKSYTATGDAFMRTLARLPFYVVHMP